MKHFLLLLIAFLPVLFSTAQEQLPNLPSELPEHKLPVGKMLLSELENTTAAIEFLNARPDTSKVGFVPARGGSYYKLTTDLSETFQKRTVAANAGNAYLFVLRKLWLKQTTPAEQQQIKIVMRQAEANKPYSACYARIEVYEKRDGVYTPLFRLDSTFEDSRLLKANAAGLLLLPFEYCINKISANTSAAFAARRKRMTLAEVEAFSFKNKVYPESYGAAMQRGIFHSFPDFLNNRPDTTSFTLQSNVLTDELVLNKSGQQRVLNDFWGFCDGTNIFIRLGLNVFQLHPVQNTYELWGFKTIKQTFAQAAPVGGTGNALITSLLMHGLNSKRISASLKPMQLDLNSGSVY